MKRSLTCIVGAAAAATLLFAPRAPSAAGAIIEDEASGQARRLLREQGIPEAGLQLLSRVATTWSDSSLGCATPGAQYTQALLSGQTLRFADVKRSYEVHVAGRRAVLCPSITSTPKRSSRFPVPVRTLDAMRENARSDLAKRLGVAVEDVAATDLAPAAWADADLGCSDGSTVAGGLVQGYRIVLRAHDREYLYHTDLHRVMACPPIEAR